MAWALYYWPVRSPSKEYETLSGGVKLRSNLWSCASIISHLAVLLLGIIFGAFVRKTFVDKTCPVIVSSTVPTPIPANVFVPLIPTVMAPDEQFVGWSDAINNNWLTILDGSDDGVWIPDAENYGLGEGFHGPSQGDHYENKTSRFYHISNQHQLHCLNILRMAFYRRIEDLEWLSSDGKKQATYHVEHCIEYLRLSITCGDLLVVEENSPPGTSSSEVADAWGKPLGWGITKKCINWENLQHWQQSQLKAWKKE